MAGQCPRTCVASGGAHALEPFVGMQWPTLRLPPDHGRQHLTPSGRDSMAVLAVAAAGVVVVVVVGAARLISIRTRWGSLLNPTPCAHSSSHAVSGCRSDRARGSSSGGRHSSISGRDSNRGSIGASCNLTRRSATRRMAVARARGSSSRSRGGGDCSISRRGGIAASSSRRRCTRSTHSSRRCVGCRSSRRSRHCCVGGGALHQ